MTGPEGRLIAVDEDGREIDIGPPPPELMEALERMVGGVVDQATQRADRDVTCFIAIDNYFRRWKT